MIKIVKKNCGHGKQVLCLQYDPAVIHPRNGQVMTVEQLDLSIYVHPKDNLEEQGNLDMLARANMMLEQRNQAIKENRLLVDYSKAGFLEFYKAFSIRASYNFTASCSMFESFCKGKCSYDMLTQEFCESYLQYLTQNGNLSNNTAAIYFRQFCQVIGGAYENGLLSVDPRPSLSPIRMERSHRRFLTDDEIRRMMASRCECPAIRKKVMFILLTGLRYGEVESLRWEDIRKDVYGRNILHLKRRRHPVYISEEAMDVISPKMKTGPVFRKINHRIALRSLSRWLQAAGIDGHYTFESFRNTRDRLP